MSETFDKRSAFETWPIAKPLYRILAFVVDSLLVAAIVFILLSFYNFPTYTFNSFYFWLIAMWFWDAFFSIFWGKSPGKMLFGLELYAPRFDGIPSPQQVSIRIILFWIGFFLLGMGLLPILYRRDHRGWHDQIAEILVVGKIRSYPHPLTIKVVPGLMLILSLLVFAGIGAKIFTKGIEATYYNPGDESCTDVENFITDGPQSFTKLLVSPAWRSCWIAIQNLNANFNDSRFYQLMVLTKDYHDAFYLDKEYRLAFYQKNLKEKEEAICQNGSSKECNSAKYLSGLLFGNNIAVSEHWFSEYENSLAFLQNSPSTFINALSEPENLLPEITKKEIMIGLEPDYVMKENYATSNENWKKAVICLQQIQAEGSPSQCDKLRKAYVALIESYNQNDAQELNDFLSRNPKDFIYYELMEIRSLFTKDAKVGEFLKNFPRSRVFYPILASL